MEAATNLLFVAAACVAAFGSTEAEVGLGAIIDSVQRSDLGGLNGCDIVLQGPSIDILREVKSESSLEHNPVILYR